MDIKLSVSVPLVAAVVAAEALSFVWYALVHRADYGERYLLTGVIADVVLAFLLQIVVRDYWRVGSLEDAAVLAAVVCLLYACLEAPHAVWNARSFSRFLVHAAHKLALVFVMVWALHYFKNHKF